MGNYRFRLSDMIPNAWFYKLKDMSRSRKRPSSTSASSKPHNSHPRYFYYNSPENLKASDTPFPDPPRKSSNRRATRRTIYKPSSAAVPSISVWTNKSIPLQDTDDYTSGFESSPEFESSLSDFVDAGNFVHPMESYEQLSSCSNLYDYNVSSSDSDIIIEMNEGSGMRKTAKVVQFDPPSELVLPPILTKPAKLDCSTREEDIAMLRRTGKLEEIKAYKSLSVKIAKKSIGKTQEEVKANPPSRKSSSSSVGIKLQTNSSRTARRKIQAYPRKSKSGISESCAVVKWSIDPQRDFKDSMVEMIVENDLRASKDLEDLLACYLSLNSKEYHDLIIKALEQIWFDMCMTDLLL